MMKDNKVALCNSLNMNFDEASELFCEESLTSMQTARINGGAEWWDKFCSWMRKLFKNAKIEISGGKDSFGITMTLYVGTTCKPTGEGIVYGQNSLALSYDGCSAQFTMTNKGEFSMISIENSGQEISTPTPA